MKIRPVGEELI